MLKLFKRIFYRYFNVKNVKIILVSRTYKWKFKHEPYLDARFVPKEVPGAESNSYFREYVDLASGYHYFNITSEEEANAIYYTSSQYEIEKFMNTTGKLRVFEDEIVGGCGSGFVDYPPLCSNCTIPATCPEPPFKVVGNPKWRLLPYQKVKHICTTISFHVNITI